MVRKSINSLQEIHQLLEEDQLHPVLQHTSSAVSERCSMNNQQVLGPYGDVKIRATQCINSSMWTCAIVTSQDVQCRQIISNMTCSDFRVPVNRVCYHWVTCRPYSHNNLSVEERYIRFTLGSRKCCEVRQLLLRHKPCLIWWMSVFPVEVSSGLVCVGIPRKTRSWILSCLSFCGWELDWIWNFFRMVGEKKHTTYQVDWTLGLWDKSFTCTHQYCFACFTSWKLTWVHLLLIFWFLETHILLLLVSFPFDKASPNFISHFFKIALFYRISIHIP